MVIVSYFSFQELKVFDYEEEVGITAYKEFTKMRKCVIQYADLNQQLATDGMTRFQYVRYIIVAQCIE